MAAEAVEVASVAVADHPIELGTEAAAQWERQRGEGAGGSLAVEAGAKCAHLGIRARDSGQNSAVFSEVRGQRSAADSGVRSDQQSKDRRTRQQVALGMHDLASEIGGNCRGRTNRTSIDRDSQVSDSYGSVNGGGPTDDRGGAQYLPAMQSRRTSRPTWVDGAVST